MLKISYWDKLLGSVLLIKLQVDLDNNKKTLQMSFQNQFDRKQST